jgi:hypothetical protein
MEVEEASRDINGKRGHQMAISVGLKMKAAEIVRPRTMGPLDPGA